MHRSFDFPKSNSNHLKNKEMLELLDDSIKQNDSSQIIEESCEEGSSTLQ